MTRTNGKKSPGGHIARFNALVEGGWLKVLSDPELRLWMAYAKYADRDGFAWPSGQALRELIGHASEGHIASGRRSLQALGLLEVVDAGGGRGHPCKVRLVIPAHAPSDRPNKPSRKPSRIGRVSEEKKTGETLPNLAINPPDFEDKPSRLHAPYKEELLRELPREQITPPPAAPSAREIDDAESDPQDQPDGGAAVPVPIVPKGNQFPPGVWRKACDGVMRAYEAVHGVRPIFKSRAWKAWAEILTAVRGDVDEFAKIVRAALCEPQRGVWEGHPPWIVLEKLNYLRSKIARGGGSNGHAISPPMTRQQMAIASLEAALDQETEMEQLVRKATVGK